jgi:hypothetical protein
MNEAAAPSDEACAPAEFSLRTYARFRLALLLVMLLDAIFSVSWLLGLKYGFEV